MNSKKSLIECRGDKEKKANIKGKKDKLFSSLFEVENFLCCLKKADECGKIVKFVLKARRK